MHLCFNKIFLLFIFQLLLLNNVSLYSKNSCLSVFKNKIRERQLKDNQYERKNYDFYSAIGYVYKYHKKFLMNADDQFYIEKIIVDNLKYSSKRRDLDLFAYLQEYCFEEKIFVFTTYRKIKVNCGHHQFIIDPAGLYFRIFDLKKEYYLDSKGKTLFLRSIETYNNKTHFNYGKSMGEEPVEYRYKDLIFSNPKLKRLYSINKGTEPRLQNKSFWLLLKK